MTILRITTVYGDRCFVTAEAFERGRVMIPLVTRDGRSVTDLPSFKPGDCHMLHRENIAEVEPVTPIKKGA